MRFKAIPILRIFDEARAREFYLDYLGMTVDFEHRFEPGMPLYMQVRKDVGGEGDLVIHLTEHHGDTTAGTRVYIDMEGLDDLHAEMKASGYKAIRPDITETPWGTREIQATDPFGNRLTFAEDREE